MTLTKEQIKSAALQLDPAERGALAEELLLSIDGVEREAIDAAWLAEAKKRDGDYLAGRKGAKPAMEVVDRLKSRRDHRASSIILKWRR
jgi:hypothetical protein